MSISSVDLANLSANLAQFKGETLASLFDRADKRVANGLGGDLLDPRAAGTAGASANGADFASLLDQFGAALRPKELPTSTTPTGLDALGSFSRPGQNMVTVLNRVEVTFKAQYAELGELAKSLLQGEGAAQQLGRLDAQSSGADIKAALDEFVQTYNAGVNRFAPGVAKGGVLEGSWEAERARFATRREIGNILTGAEAGHKGGLATLGVSVDPQTGLASIDAAQFDSALAGNKGRVVAALDDFADAFVAMVDSLTATDHAQSRQMDNLHRAVDWIDANKAAVRQEFGAGAAATPNAAFAKAAAQYDDISHLI
ncbi:MAG: hypothetical protein H7Z39_03655 [Burkholderiaceae bacterium]|nr:hypothetical protein [Burkholderiaceae bacterium]